MTPSMGKQRSRFVTMRERLRRWVDQHQGEVVLRRDLRRLGSASQVSRGLRQLVNDGKLVRIGLGVYAKATPSPLCEVMLDMVLKAVVNTSGTLWRRTSWKLKDSHLMGMSSKFGRLASFRRLTSEKNYALRHSVLVTNGSWEQ